MKVAWHVVPGKCRTTIPSRRERYDIGVAVRQSNGSTSRRSPFAKNIFAPPTSIIPYPTGRSLFLAHSRHYVPGYLNSVPPGQGISNHFFPIRHAVLGTGTSCFQGCGFDRSLNGSFQAKPFRNTDSQPSYETVARAGRIDRHYFGCRH